MNELTQNKELANWFSTYSFITAQRLLERFKIKLQHEDLLFALKTPGNFYYQILLLPLQNVFNGIILQQARDYQLYAQKLFIDYLISGESTKEENSPGESTREEIEAERVNLVAMNEEFRQIEIRHEKLIADSQSLLIKTAEKWQKSVLGIGSTINNCLKRQDIIIPQSLVNASITTLLVTYNFDDAFFTQEIWERIENKMNLSLSEDLRQLFKDEIKKLSKIIPTSEEASKQFSEHATDLNIMLKQYRKRFKAFIIAVNELMKLLPVCPLDEDQLNTNRQELYFDAELGEKT